MGCDFWNDSGSNNFFNISGQIKDSEGEGIQGVTIKFKNGFGTTLTDEEGRWNKTGLEDIVEVIPIKKGYIFDPEKKVAVGDVEEIVFIGYENNQVKFEDANLELVVREKIKKPVDKLKISDVISIKQLEARGKKIESLEGIQNLHNLEKLYLNERGYGSDSMEINKIESLKPLSNLTNLKELVFRFNQVEDITPLKNLNELEWLDFRDNKVQDIKILKNLTNLTFLDFSFNSIEDISSLQNLKNLKIILFGFTDVGDISALEKLTKVEQLWFSQNQKVQCIDALKNLERLAVLNIGDNLIKDISPIKNLHNLELLGIGLNQVEDLSPIENLSKLESANFRSNKINDIKPLVRNEELGTGDFIDLRHNFLDIQEGSQNKKDIKLLKKRGVEVEYNPQQEKEEVSTSKKYVTNNGPDFIEEMTEELSF